MLSPEIWSIPGGLTLNYFGFSKKCSSQNNNFMIFQDKCSKYIDIWDTILNKYLK